MHHQGMYKDNWFWVQGDNFQKSTQENSGGTRVTTMGCVVDVDPIEDNRRSRKVAPQILINAKQLSPKKNIEVCYVRKDKLFFLTIQVIIIFSSHVLSE